MTLTLDDLPTPALVLDRSKLAANCRRLADRLPPGVRLRPHLKTSKSIDVARIALSGREEAATVSTLKEAEYFHAHGVSDLMYAVGVVPDKLARAAQLLRDGARLHLVTDDRGVAKTIGRRGEELGVVFSCYLEIDVDGHRAGIAPTDGALIEIAQVLRSSPGARFAGVMTHAGESYACRGHEELVAAAEAERRGVVAAATRLHEAGLPCPEVSAGSSPTAFSARSFEGLTEVRAGVYVFWDLFQSNVGVCSVDEIALSVLGSVIGHQPRRGQILIDAGGHALSKDRGTGSQSTDYRFGQVADLDGQPLRGTLVTKANQEHGVVESIDGGIDFDRFPIGSRVRVLPNHACATAACHDRYFVVDDGREVVAEWPRINGW